ncbi:hypothetical protein RQP46_011338 [Phenoliferia psychrophenolica]
MSFLFARLPSLLRPSTFLPIRAFANPFSSTAPAALLRKPTKTKLKTHKGAAKRWLVVANGNYKRSKAGKVHLNGHLSPTRLNRLGEPAYARPIEKKLLRRLLPYA